MTLAPTYPRERADGSTSRRSSSEAEAQTQAQATTEAEAEVSGFAIAGGVPIEGMTLTCPKCMGDVTLNHSYVVTDHGTYHAACKSESFKPGTICTSDSEAFARSAEKMARDLYPEKPERPVDKTETAVALRVAKAVMTWQGSELDANQFISLIECIKESL